MAEAEADADGEEEEADGALVRVDRGKLLVAGEEVAVVRPLAAGAEEAPRLVPAVLVPGAEVEPVAHGAEVAVLGLEVEATLTLVAEEAEAKRGELAISVAKLDIGREIVLRDKAAGE